MADPLLVKSSPTIKLPDSVVRLLFVKSLAIDVFMPRLRVALPLLVRSLPMVRFPLMEALLLLMKSLSIVALPRLRIALLLFVKLLPAEMLPLVELIVPLLVKSLPTSKVPELVKVTLEPMVKSRLSRINLNIPWLLIGPEMVRSEF